MVLHGPFTTTRLAKILELPERKIFSFIERGYLTPSLQDAKGRGSTRLWSYHDVIRGAAIKLSLDISSVQTARTLAAWMDNQRAREFKYILFIPGGTGTGQIVTAELPKETGSYEVIVKQVRLKFPVALVIDFASIARWVDERIDDLGFE